MWSFIFKVELSSKLHFLCAATLKIPNKHLPYLFKTVMSTVPKSILLFVWFTKNVLNALHTIRCINLTFRLHFQAEYLLAIIGFSNFTSLKSISIFKFWLTKFMFDLKRKILVKKREIIIISDGHILNAALITHS